MEQDQTSSIFEMDIDSVAQNRLNTISKWGKFIAITVLVLLILVVLVLATQYDVFIDQITAMLALDSDVMGVIIAVLAVVGVLCFIWIIYLLRACSFIKQGLMTQNSDRISEGFKSFKVVFTVSIVFSVLGILTSLYSLINN
jgi:hypothetical protein